MVAFLWRTNTKTSITKGRRGKREKGEKGKKKVRKGERDGKGKEPSSPVSEEQTCVKKREKSMHNGKGIWDPQPLHLPSLWFAPLLQLFDFLCVSSLSVTMLVAYLSESRRCSHRESEEKKKNDAKMTVEWSGAEEDRACGPYREEG